MDDITIPPDAWRYTSAQNATYKLHRISLSEERLNAFKSYIDQCESDLYATWRESNPEAWHRSQIAAAKFRAKRWGSKHVPYTAAELEAKYQAQGRRCYYCAIELDQFYSIDHKTPLSKGGADAISNLAACCVPCNRRKFVKSADEFLEAITATAQPTLFGIPA